jgi:site-specific DNA recombinase
VNAARGRQSSTCAIASPLAGKIFDADGEPIYAQGAAKAGRQYRYYVSRSLAKGSSSDDRKSWRLAAPELERAVAIATRHILSDRAGMLEVLEWLWLQSPDIIAIIESTSALSRRLENEADSKDCMVELVDRIELCDDGVGVTLKIRFPVSARRCRRAAFLGCPASCHSK